MEECKMNANSKVSVIIPVYDRRDYVRIAVNSCLNQEYDKDKLEIIVVKNFLDNDLEKWFSQNFILYIDSKKTSLVDKIIEGMDISTGEIICLLEDDDEFVSNKIEIINKYFDDNPDISCLHNNYLTIEEGNNQPNIYSYGHKKELEKVLRLNEKRKMLSLIKHKDIYHNLSCWSFRRDYGPKLLNRLAGLTYDIDFLIYIEVISNQIEMLFLPEELTIYRRHQSASKLTKEDEKIVNLLKLSIFSLNSVQNKISQKEIKIYIESNLIIERFKLYIMEKKGPQIDDIRNSIKVMMFPTYINRELYPFLFLYFTLGILKEARKKIYMKIAYILN